MIFTKYQKQLLNEIASEKILNVIDFITNHLRLTKSPFDGHKTKFTEGYMLCISRLNPNEGRNKISEFFSLCSSLEKLGLILYITDDVRKKHKSNGFEIHFTKKVKPLLETSHFLSIDNYASKLYDIDFLVLPQLHAFIKNKFRTQEEIQSYHSRIIGYTGIVATIVFIIINFFTEIGVKKVIIEKSSDANDTTLVKIIEDKPSGEKLSKNKEEKIFEIQEQKMNKDSVEINSD